MYGPKLSARQVAKRKQPTYGKDAVEHSHAKKVSKFTKWKWENELLYGSLIKSTPDINQHGYVIESSAGQYSQMDGIPFGESTVNSVSASNNLGNFNSWHPEQKHSVAVGTHAAESYELDTSGIDPILLFPLIHVSEQGMGEKELPLPSVHLPLPEKQHMPSVTHILKETMSPENVAILQRWEEQMIKKLGVEGFKEYKQNLFEKGVNLHECIEQFLHGCSEEDLPLSSAASGHWHSLSPILQHVENLHSTELAVTHKHLGYTGIYDCLANYKNQLCVIEWKTSTKRKSSLKATFDNPLQVAAYVGALNYDKTRPVQVDSALLVICYEDGSQAHAHFISRSQLQMYWSRWLERLHSYWCTRVSKQAAQTAAQQAR